MQKKLIALAVAALASSAAFAQSNVTIYGSVDVGFSHRSDHEKVLDPNTGRFKSVGSQNAIDSGISGDSLIGFKGVEDLGNGVKALFVLEAGFTADDGTETEGRLFGKQAFLGLTGGFGTAIAGRLVAPRYSFLSALDPFGDGTVGRFHNVYSDTAVVFTNVDRVDNAVAYVSPSFSGFSVTGAYATNAIAAENLANNSDARVFTVLPRYTNGPLDTGLVYQQIKVKNTDNKIKQWAIGGAYDFKVVKLSAFYDRYKFDEVDYDQKSWHLGVSVPFGKHAVLASYNQSKFSDASKSGKAKQFAVGYNYSLSKRTKVYAAISSISNDDGDNDYVRTASVGDANNLGDGYQDGFQFGLKHDF